MLAPSLFFLCANIADILFEKTQGTLTLLVFHVLFFKSPTPPSFFLCLLSGFFIDAYSHHGFLGVTSLYLILCFMFLERIKIWVYKLGNFWLIWGSFCAIVLMYKVTFMTFFYTQTGTFHYARSSFLWLFFMISVYPLVFHFFPVIKRRV